MADGDFYSKYTGEEIEKILDGSVLFNEYQQLSDIQKQQARRNIGAGTVDSGLIIKGYYSSYEELTAAQSDPQISDAYGVGTEPPYNIFVWDDVNKMWINNGTITKGDKGDPGQDGEAPTAENIAAALGYTPAANDLSNVQPGAVTAAKLKDGAISRSKLARDALYSPVLAIEAVTLIGAEHCGMTLLAGTEAALSIAYDETIPVGAEIAVLNTGEAAVTISAGVNTAFLLCDGSTPETVTVTPFGMAAAKLISRDTVEQLDRWYISGNAEVVE